MFQTWKKEGEEKRRLRDDEGKRKEKKKKRRLFLGGKGDADCFFLLFGEKGKKKEATVRGEGEVGFRGGGKWGRAVSLLLSYREEGKGGKKKKGCFLVVGKGNFTWSMYVRAERKRKKGNT